jgi:pyocin large subunit-like protein
MKWALAVLGGCAALALAACDNGPSAVAGAKQAAGTQMAVNEAPSRFDDSTADEGDRGARAADHRKDPVKMVGGVPMWSASRKHSAQDNAEYAFRKNGQAFGAHDVDDFVKKAHAFVDHPPKGTLTLTRANGDTLFYDPKGNVFAVATKAGAPRTMFKPQEGMAYWDEQKAREAKRQASARERRSRNRDDEA